MKEFRRYIVFVVTGLFLSILIGCATSSPTPILSPSLPAVALRQLLVDTSALPGDWYVERGPQEYPEQRGQENSLYVGFGTKTFESPMFHIVLQYKNSEYASKKYRQYLPAEFGNAFRITPWKVPAELNYQSDIADQFQFACADFQNASATSKTYSLCVAMGQYGRYVSVFSTYISQDVMNYADLEKVLRTIDERMASFNGSPDFNGKHM